jgi:hypothetical protein
VVQHRAWASESRLRPKGQELKSQNPHQKVLQKTMIGNLGMMLQSQEPCSTGGKGGGLSQNKPK